MLSVSTTDGKSARMAKGQRLYAHAAGPAILPIAAAAARKLYQGKAPVPLLERNLPLAGLRHDASPGELSDVARAQLVRTREMPVQRTGRCNAYLDQSETNAVCLLVAEDRAVSQNAIDPLQLSARSVHSILRVARIIADKARMAPSRAA